MPILLLSAILANFYSLFFILLDLYLWREWYRYKDLIDPLAQEYAQRCFLGAILVLLFACFGRLIIRLVLSSRKAGEVAPKLERYAEQQRLHRPDGSIIHVEQGGVKGKQTIIFIHGWNSNSMQWFYQKKYFEQDYHLVLMDHAGLGLSKRPDNKDYSLEKLAADLHAVIENTAVNNPILWGHSMGGFTILTYCKLYPAYLKRITGLILEHTTYTNPTKTSILSGLITALQNPVLKPLCWLMIAFSPLVWIGRWMSYLNGGSLIMTRLLTFAGTQTARQLDFTSLLATMAPPAITGRGVLGMFNYDATLFLGQIPLPTLVVGAEADKLTTLAASIKMKQSIPHAELLVLTPAGHMGFVEQHQHVNARVFKFINSIKTG